MAQHVLRRPSEEMLFAQDFLHDLHLPQVQLDELYAVLSAFKDGEVSEAEAIERLSRSPHWVWAAMEPESKLLLTIEVGARTLAMAQPCCIRSRCSWRPIVSRYF